MLDLEWNNAYCRKLGRFMNEILEIGAVKLDENLQEVSRFSCVVRSSLTGKVRHFVKALTSISNEEMAAGLPLADAFSDFTYWLDDGQPYVIITWSNTDLFVLLENFEVFFEQKELPFVQMYADLQRYIQFLIAPPGRGQISLSTACEMLSIDIENVALHRALDDAQLCAELFKARFDPDRFSAYISVANQDFYRRLTFKKHFIVNLNDERIDAKSLQFRCPECGVYMKRAGKLWTKSSAFHGRYTCSKCGGEHIGIVRFKCTYDDVIIRRSLNPVAPPEPEPEEAAAETTAEAAAETAIETTAEIVTETASEATAIEAAAI